MVEDHSKLRWDLIRRLVGQEKQESGLVCSKYRLVRQAQVLGVKSVLSL